MVIYKNKSLQSYNTFGLEVKAENLIKVDSEEALQEAFYLSYRPIFLLGGGSNILLTQDIKGLVLKNEIKGITVVQKKKNTVTIAVGGGENWHELVLWCLRKNYGGIENLSLIPGTVGAAPIQNIGAYGVELKDVFEKLEAIELKTGKQKIFTNKDCQFGYRESIFKKTLKGKFFLTKIYLTLTRKNHTLHLNYGAIKNQLAANQIEQPTIQDISTAIIQIRSSKLPDPAVLGNSGSFFKNPEIPRSQFEGLKKQFPNIVFYDLPNGQVKVPAGWLIEQCGWKGKRVGNTGAYAKQALVLVNYGGATGQEVKQLAGQIVDSVQEKFGIELLAEVNVI